MNCIITDDEPLARRGIENFVKDIPFLHLNASCESALQALDEIKKQPTDLLFLDIQMPRMSGLDMLRNTANPPITIITTAFPDHAVDSFELSVIDYLLKPIPFERFVKAVNKARDYFELQQKATEGSAATHDYFFIKCDLKFEKIFFAELLFVEALQNYVVLHTQHRKYISYLTMKHVEDYLPDAQFIKVNKSYIISLSRIDNITGNTIQIGAHTFAAGRSNKEEIMNRILGERLLTRKQ